MNEGRKEGRKEGTAAIIIMIIKITKTSIKAS
jgi:hypothetical protein